MWTGLIQWSAFSCAGKAAVSHSFTEIQCSFCLSRPTSAHRPSCASNKTSPALQASHTSFRSSCSFLQMLGVCVWLWSMKLTLIGGLDSAVHLFFLLLQERVLFLQLLHPLQKEGKVTPPFNLKPSDKQARLTVIKPVQIIYSGVHKLNILFILHF